MKTDRTDTAAVEALADSIAHTFDRDDDGRGWVFDSAQLAEFARRLTATQPGAAVPAGFTIDRIDRQTKRAGRVHGLQVMTPPDEEGFSFACFLDANAHHAAVQLIDAFLALNKPGAAVPEVMEDRVIVAAKAISAIRQGSDRAFRMYLDDARAALLAAAPAPEGSALKLGACGVLPSSSLIDSLKTTEALRTLCHQLNAERRKITAAIDPDSAPSSPAPRPCPDMSKSWPERDYMCECSQCGSQFIGAKRQAVCKACAPAPSESLDESLLRTIREIAPAVGGEAVAEIIAADGGLNGKMLNWKRGLVPFIRDASIGTKLYTYPAAVQPDGFTGERIEQIDGESRVVRRDGGRFVSSVPAPAAVEAGGLEALAEAVCAIIEEHHPEFVDYMPCARDVARRLASAQRAGKEGA